MRPIWEPNFAFYLTKASVSWRAEAGGFRFPQDRDYGIPSKVEPKPWEEFHAEMQALGDLFGLKPKYSFLRERKEGGFDSVPALRIQYPGKQIEFVRKGEVSYLGWDVPDRYLVVTIDGVEWAFWSEDAHGGPLTRSAMKGTDDWQMFETFLVQK